MAVLEFTVIESLVMDSDLSLIHKHKVAVHFRSMMRHIFKVILWNDMKED